MIGYKSGIYGADENGNWIVVAAVHVQGRHQPDSQHLGVDHRKLKYYEVEE